MPASPAAYPIPCSRTGDAEIDRLPIFLPGGRPTDKVAIHRPAAFRAIWRRRVQVRACLDGDLRRHGLVAFPNMRAGLLHLACDLLQFQRPRLFGSRHVGSTILEEIRD